MGRAFFYGAAIVCAAITGSAGGSEFGTYGSEVLVYAQPLPYEQRGGEHQVQAQWDADGGWIDIGTTITYFSQRAQARALADARLGALKAESFGAVTLWEPCDPCSASTPSSLARAQFWDSFRIRPGNGFNVGDTARVAVIASLEGSVALHGTPSAGSEYGFGAYFGPSLGMSSDNLFQVDLYRSLSPTKVEAVGPTLWRKVVDVTVGQAYFLHSELRTQHGSSGYYGYGLGFYEDYVDFYGTGSAGLAYAPGFERLLIESAAGASIAPVPEPTVVLMMVVGLGALLVFRPRRESGKED